MVVGLTVVVVVGLTVVVVGLTVVVVGLTVVVVTTRVGTRGITAVLLATLISSPIIAAMVQRIGVVGARARVVVNTPGGTTVTVD